MNNTVYLYVFDTMSDWEIGYLTAELNSGRYYKKGLDPHSSTLISGSIFNPPIVVTIVFSIPTVTTFNEMCKQLLARNKTMND